VAAAILGISQFRPPALSGLRFPGASSSLFDHDYALSNGAYIQSWFTDPSIKEQVSEMLSEFGFNTAAIETEAIRLSLPELGFLDRLIGALEARRDKELHRIAEYRGSLAAQLRETSNRIIDANAVNVCSRQVKPSGSEA
jgi:hypothetical protein